MRRTQSELPRTGSSRLATAIQKPTELNGHAPFQFQTQQPTSMSSSQTTIPETQKAWITMRKGAPSASLEFKTDWPVKKNLAAGEVLVKVHAAALNPLYVHLCP